MEYDKINLGAYNLHFIKTERFKTTTISVNFREKIEKENITKRNFLFELLTTTSLKYNTERLLQRELENLYSLSLSSSSIKFGNIINNYIDIKFLNNKYSDEDLLSNSINLLFELIFNPNVDEIGFNEKVFNETKDIIAISINSLYEKPATYANIRALEVMDENDPVSYNMFGYKSDLDKIDRKNLYEYYKEVLKKDIIDVFIIGDVDKNQVIDLFKEKFKINTMKMDKITPYITYSSIDKCISYKESIRGLKQAKLSVICKIINITDFERRYVMPIYASILGGSANSKLFMNVREKMSLAYTINASTKSPNSILMINAGIDKENYEKVVEIIKKEIKSMKKVTDEEINSAKSEIISTLDSLFDNPAGIINYYFGIEVFNSDNIDVKKESYMKVNKKDIINFSNKIKIATTYILEGGNNEE